MPIKDPASSSNLYTILWGDWCFYCPKLGHALNQFLEWRCQIVYLATYSSKNKEPNNEPYKDNKDTENEEEWTYIDENVSLIIQCLLYTPKKDENTQIHSIFKSKCTINKMVCDLIIDSSSSKNIVPKLLVYKLQLKIQKHHFHVALDGRNMLERLKMPHFFFY